MNSQPPNNNNSNEHLPEPEWDEADDLETFIECDRCDGHEACRDFGCAFDLGLRWLVKNETPWDL